MIRPFSERDADLCRKIIKNCFKETVSSEEKIKSAVLSRLAAKGYLESKAKEYPLFVYEKDKKVVGMGGLKGNEIKRVYVDPSYQGKGIGKEILHFLEKLAREKGLDELVLYSFPNSVRFYQKQGYKIVGVHGYEIPKKGIKIPTTEMRKKI